MPEPVFGVLALFDSAADLVKAVPQIREQGFHDIEAYTPYPVHGLDKVLGLKKSSLGYLVFVMAALGCVGTFVFEWWTSAVGYPLHIGGKPLNSWQAFVPPAFEVTVLFATFTAGLAMLFLYNRLPFFGNPILKSDAIREITRDRFALVITAVKGALDTEAASAALRTIGARKIEIVSAAMDPPPGLGWWVRTALGIAVVCIVAGLGMTWIIKIYPTVKPMVNMEVQPKLTPERYDAFFANDRGMRRPPTGTVSRGHMPILAKSFEQAGKELVNPLPMTQDVLARGRHEFDIHCAVCHDALGTGKPWLDQQYKANPTNLQSSAIRNAPDGSLFWVISKGQGVMPSYGSDISVKDRWAIVDYVRALERSQHALKKDLP